MKLYSVLLDGALVTAYIVAASFRAASEAAMRRWLDGRVIAIREVPAHSVIVDGVSDGR